jgi:hypothetical protein
MTLTNGQLQELQEDFIQWSGGYPPESDEQITVYIDYAQPADLDSEKVRQFLRKWMEEE